MMSVQVTLLCTVLQVWSSSPTPVNDVSSGHPIMYSPPSLEFQPTPVNDASPGHPVMYSPPILEFQPTPVNDARPEHNDPQSVQITLLCTVHQVWSSSPTLSMMPVQVILLCTAHPCQ